MQHLKNYLNRTSKKSVYTLHQNFVHTKEKFSCFSSELKKQAVMIADLSQLPVLPRV